MSTPRESAGVETSAPPAKTAAGRGLPALLGVLALLVSIAALLIALFVYQEARRSGAESLAAAGAETARIADRVDRLERDLAQAASDARVARDGLAALEQKESAAAQAIAELAATSRQTNLDWALAEIEYLLIIATHRLQLLHDVPTALAAMQAAAVRLENLDAPGLEALRAQLSEDMDALKAVQDVDITGLTLYLTDLAARVDSLPLGRKSARQQGEEGAGAAAEAGWRGLLRSIWREFRSLVVVTRAGPGAGATLLPEEQYFLFQNLRLQIETARFAVVRRDTRMLRASLAEIDDWLRSYFDTGSTDVANVLEAFARMQQLELDPELPGLNSSMETLRAFVRERAGGVPPQEPAGPPP